eukprot:gene17194-20489_t
MAHHRYVECLYTEEDYAEEEDYTEEDTEDTEEEEEEEEDTEEEDDESTEEEDEEESTDEESTDEESSLCTEDEERISKQRLIESYQHYQPTESEIKMSDYNRCVTGYLLPLRLVEKIFTYACENVTVPSQPALKDLLSTISSGGDINPDLDPTSDTSGQVPFAYLEIVNSYSSITTMEGKIANGVQQVFSYLINNQFYKYKDTVENEIVTVMIQIEDSDISPIRQVVSSHPALKDLLTTLKSEGDFNHDLDPTADTSGQVPFNYFEAVTSASFTTVMEGKIATGVQQVFSFRIINQFYKYKDNVQNEIVTVMIQKIYSSPATEAINDPKNCIGFFQTHLSVMNHLVLANGATVPNNGLFNLESSSPATVDQTHTLTSTSTTKTEISVGFTFGSADGSVSGNIDHTWTKSTQDVEQISDWGIVEITDPVTQSPGWVFHQQFPWDGYSLGYDNFPSWYSQAYDGGSVRYPPNLSTGTLQASTSTIWRCVGATIAAHHLPSSDLEKFGWLKNKSIFALLSIYTPGAHHHAVVILSLFYYSSFVVNADWAPVFLKGISSQDQRYAHCMVTVESNILYDGNPPYNLIIDERIGDGTDAVQKLNNSFWVFGGASWTGEDYKLLKTDNNLFVVQTDEKVPLPMYPTPRTFHSSAGNESYLFLFGGLDNNQTVLGDLWIYSLLNHTWINMDVMQISKPQPRYGHSTVLAQNKLWLFGGLDFLGRSLMDLWSFDLMTLEWVLIDADGYISPRAFHSMVADEKKGRAIFVFGGNDQPSSTSMFDLVVFDIESNSWSQLTPSITPMGLDQTKLSFSSDLNGFVLYGSSKTMPMPDNFWDYDLDCDCNNRGGCFYGYAIIMTFVDASFMVLVIPLSLKLYKHRKMIDTLTNSSLGSYHTGEFTGLTPLVKKMSHTSGETVGSDSNEKALNYLQKEHRLRIDLNLIRISKATDYSQLFSLPTNQLLQNINVKFIGEEGIDLGGLKKEWFSLLFKQLFDNQYGLFMTNSNYTLSINPNSHLQADYLTYFYFAGRMVAKSVSEGIHLDHTFSRTIYKMILGKPACLDDLIYVDAEYYNSLIWILENSIEDMEEVTFSTTVDNNGTPMLVDLIENGRDIAVTEENKHEFVKLLSEWRFKRDISDQSFQFVQGFRELIPLELISCLNECELELFMCGLTEIDTNDWRANTIYRGYNASSQVVEWFWQVVEEMEMERRIRLLQFVTGNARLPPSGFQGLMSAEGLVKFQIHKSYAPDNQLPVARTCFNRLDLPNYDSLESIQKAIHIAIHEGLPGFGLA